MSYCVNCGVELDKTRGICPLCNTAVQNPNQPVDRVSPTPYPKNVGTSEQVDQREITSLVTIVFVTISLVCGLLNWLVFDRTKWSLYIIGIFVMLWVFILPLLLRDKINPFVAIAMDGTAMALFVGMIALLHPGMGWYQEIALPIIVVSTAMLEVFYLFNIRMKIPAIAKTMVIVGLVAVISVSIEVLIGFHFNRRIVLVWSAVVLACCVAVNVILFAVLHHKGARDELRKRMHF